MATIKFSNRVVVLLNRVLSESSINDVDVINIMELSYSFTYVDISETDPTRLSGMNMNKKLTEKPTDYERESQGVFLKPGKLIKALVPELTSDQLSIIAARLARELTGGCENLMDRLQISDTPSKIYYLNHGDRGNLGSSCMRGKSSDMFELYDDDPNMRILYLVDEGDDRRLLARALLHGRVYQERSEQPIKVMDRVYVCNDNYENVFFRWAKENGYYRKASQACDEFYEYVTPEGEDVELSLKIHVHSEEYEAAPYLDTFQYYCSCNGVLRTNSNYCYEDQLCDTEGGTENGVLVGVSNYCEHCGDRIGRDDESHRVGHDELCETCYGDQTSYCDGCGVDHYNESMGHYKLVDGSELFRCDSCAEDFICCEGCDKYTEDGVTTVEFRGGGSKELCETCVDELEYELTTCSQCFSEYQDNLEECPYCRVQFLAKKRRKNLAAAVGGYCRRNGVKNSSENLMFFGDTLVKLNIDGSRVLLRKSVIESQTGHLGRRIRLIEVEFFSLFRVSSAREFLVQLMTGTLDKEVRG